MSGPTKWELEVIATEHAFFAGQFVTTLFYGVFIGMFISCAPALFNQIRQRKLLILVVAYVACALVSGAVFCVDQEYKLNTAYIDNRNYFGGPEVYLRVKQRWIINSLCPFLIVTLSDLFMVWRCWEILGRNLRALLYTTLTSIAPIALTLAFGIISVLQLGPNTTPYTILPIDLNAIYYGVSMGHNFLLSVAIVASLLTRRRDLTNAGEGEHARRYISWQAVVTETGVIYTLVSIIAFAVEIGVFKPETPILFVIVPFIQPILRFPIIYRIAHGTDLTREVLYPDVVSLPSKGIKSVTVITDKGA